MKKFLAVILVIVALFTVVSISGCNRWVIDTNYTFDRAILILPNGEIIEGKVQKWTDYEDGDQIQVQIDGTVYLVHSSNIVLINDK